jgi:hypothetical protein
LVGDHGSFWGRGIDACGGILWAIGITKSSVKGLGLLTGVDWAVEHIYLKIMKKGGMTRFILLERG